MVIKTYKLDLLLSETDLVAMWVQGVETITAVEHSTNFLEKQFWLLLLVPR